MKIDEDSKKGPHPTNHLRYGFESTTLFFPPSPRKEEVVNGSITGNDTF